MQLPRKERKSDGDVEGRRRGEEVSQEGAQEVEKKCHKKGQGRGRVVGEGRGRRMGRGRAFYLHAYYICTVYLALFTGPMHTAIQR